MMPLLTWQTSVSLKTVSSGEEKDHIFFCRCSIQALMTTALMLKHFKHLENALSVCFMQPLHVSGILDCLKKNS